MLIKKIIELRDSFYRTRLFRLYGDLKIVYKLTIYFTIFGIVVAFFSFIIYTAVSTYNFHRISSILIKKSIQVSALPADFIVMLPEKKNRAIIDESSFFKQIFERDISLLHNVIGFKLYYSESDGVWQELHFSRGEPAGFRPADGVVTGYQGLSYLSWSLFSDQGVSFWIDLTRPIDKNKYIMELRVNRKGIIELAGGVEALTIDALLIICFSALLSKWISGFIARPVNDLNAQASRIASGDFTAKSVAFRNDEIGELSASLNTMAEKISIYVNDLKERMDSISVMNRIDRAVLSSISRQDLLERVTSLVSGLFSDCAVALILENRVEGRYELLSHFEKGDKGSLPAGSYLDYSSLGEGIVEMNRSYYSINKSSGAEKLEYLNFFLGVNYTSIVNLPILIDEQYQGSLIIGREGGRLFTESQEQVLMALADQVGVAMKSVRFIEEKEQLYLGILKALSKAIDAKSRWTAGHSDRVAVYSEKLALKLGRDPDFIEDLKISSALHDIGKIGVPELLLDKPGKLTEAEIELIKTHPEKGSMIIENIPGYEKFIDGVLFHHEQWNGEGYPRGLSGDEIPLMARILTAADIYDAVISDRPYRKGMSLDRTLLLIDEEKGRKLDPEIAQILIDIIKSENSEDDL